MRSDGAASRSGGAVERPGAAAASGPHFVTNRTPSAPTESPRRQIRRTNSPASPGSAPGAKSKTTKSFPAPDIFQNLIIRIAPLPARGLEAEDMISERSLGGSALV